jgi:O-antigen/teichoic acid export membrane protein
VAAGLVHQLPTRSDAESWSLTLSAALLAGCVTGVSFGALGLLLVPLVSPSLEVVRSDATLAASFVAGVAVWTVSLVLDYVFIAERASSRMAAKAAVFGLAKLPLLVIPAAVGLSEGGTTVIFESWVGASLISVGLATVLWLPRLRFSYVPQLRGTFVEMRRLASVMLKNHLTTLGNVLPSYSLPLVVVSQKSTTDNAYFYVAWMLGGVFFMVSSTVASSLFAEGRHAPDDVARRIRESVRYCALILAPLMIVVAVLSDPLLSLFGNEYSDNGRTLLLILIVAAIPDAITNIYLAALRIEDRLATAAVLTMGMAGVATVAAAILVGSAGLSGLGIAWLLAQCLGTVFVAIDLVHKRRPLLKPSTR